MLYSMAQGRFSWLLSGPVAHAGIGFGLIQTRMHYILVYDLSRVIWPLQSKLACSSVERASIGGLSRNDVPGYRSSCPEFRA